MALGEFTKQIAQQAILSATTKEPPPAQGAENVTAVVLGQIHGMQKALKDDEELVVHCGGIRVMEIFAPSRQIVVLTGAEAGALVRVVSAVETLQLVCKVAKAPAGSKPTRVALITPKQKDSSA